MTTIIKEFEKKDSESRIRIFVEFKCDSCQQISFKQKRFLKETNFCSRKCGSQFKLAKITTEVICRFCSKIFRKKNSTLHNSKSGIYFCSKKCKDSGQKIVNGIKEVWPNHYGLADGIYGYRKYALNFYEKKCEDCGYSDIPEILQVHHKDLNRTNNDISNLKVVCPNCHCKIHFLSKTGIFKNKLE